LKSAAKAKYDEELKEHNDAIAAVKLVYPMIDKFATANTKEGFL